MQENNIVIQRALKFKPYECIVLASDRCQVCFSKTDFQQGHLEPPDRLIKCKLCLSSIHQTHYGSDLIGEIPQQWYCERCTYLLNDPEGKTSLQCYFCPNLKGIMKTIQIDKKKVWSHLQCITWDYPVRTFTCQRLLSVKRLLKPQSEAQMFWYPQFHNPKCQHCLSNTGQFVKCRYYNCGNHYHVPCAKLLGVIRQLQQMRVQNNDMYTYIPVLCPEHLQRRGIDFRNKADKIQDKQKFKHITNLAKIYQKQYAQLLKASKQQMKPQLYKLVYDSDQTRSNAMQVQSLSQQTPVGQDSIYSANICNFLQQKLGNVLDNFQFDNL